ncbi:hypothetical protein L596_025049 [Steinernema carpocapsae]|uniref:Uncharacterized protein n=1 Tax=Steinernema carpocapsae TaxID=34508 RepID=A0A4U5M6N8_STECR|nr:hypothetical protein L596_025049 [Steinernema carpocapsae]
MWLLYLYLLLFTLIAATTQVPTWGQEKIASFDMRRFLPPSVQTFVNMTENQHPGLLETAFNQMAKEREAGNYPDEATTEDGQYSLIFHLTSKLDDLTPAENSHDLGDELDQAFQSAIPPHEEDNVTESKLTMIMDDSIEAWIYQDGYHISYALWHYMHMREGLGKSRQLIRLALPGCEKLAKVPDVREFYKKRKGENPTSLRVLKDFMDLLEWLDYENKLEHIMIAPVPRRKAFK